jgi:hypothetical protein
MTKSVLKSIDYYSGNDVAPPWPIPIPPSKFLDKASPAALRKHADELEAFQLANKTYNQERSAHQQMLEQRKVELQYHLCCNSSLNIPQGVLLFRRAWEEKHSEGIEAVIDEFTDLVELINSYNAAH